MENIGASLRLQRSATRPVWPVAPPSRSSKSAGEDHWLSIRPSTLFGRAMSTLQQTLDLLDLDTILRLTDFTKAVDDQKVLLFDYNEDLAR